MRFKLLKLAMLMGAADEDVLAYMTSLSSIAPN
jgi:hypothetical protein